MEALFKNKTTFSQENYMKLVAFHQKKNNWKYWLYTATFSILLIICLAFQLIAKDYLFVFICLFILFGFLAYRFINPYHKTRKELSSDKVQNHMINYYFFYEKYFKIKNKLGTSKLKYYKLHKVYETKEYFYLYIAKDYAFILDKNGFEIGSTKQFSQFMKHKMRFKFSKEAK